MPRQSDEKLIGFNAKNDQIALIDQAAALLGMDRSSFMRSTLLERARVVVAELSAKSKTKAA